MQNEPVKSQIIITKISHLLIVSQAIRVRDDHDELVEFFVRLDVDLNVKGAR